MATHGFSSRDLRMKNYAYSGNHEAVIINMNKRGVDFTVSVADITIFFIFFKTVVSRMKKDYLSTAAFTKSRERSR